MCSRQLQGSVKSWWVFVTYVDRRSMSCITDGWRDLLLFVLPPLVYSLHDFPHDDHEHIDEEHFYKLDDANNRTAQPQTQLASKVR
eukprot:g31991.t1